MLPTLPKEPQLPPSPISPVPIKRPTLAPPLCVARPARRLSFGNVPRKKACSVNQESAFMNNP